MGDAADAILDGDICGECGEARPCPCDGDEPWCQLCGATEPEDCDCLCPCCGAMGCDCDCSGWDDDE